MDLGLLGEVLALDFLKQNGFKIIKRNYRTRFGEVDIIARDKDTFCFIEVKARKNNKFGLPQEAVSLNKQRHIARAAIWFLKENKLTERKARFDVVSVVYREGEPEVTLLKNAFELDEKFCI